MKSICKILILLLLVLSLALALLSCVGGTETNQGDDSWVATDEDGTVERQKAMRQQQFNDDDDENAYQSNERLQLPTIIP